MAEGRIVFPFPKRGKRETHEYRFQETPGNAEETGNALRQQGLQS